MGRQLDVSFDGPPGSSEWLRLLAKLGAAGTTDAIAATVCETVRALLPSDVQVSVLGLAAREGTRGLEVWVAASSKDEDVGASVEIARFPEVLEAVRLRDAVFVPDLGGDAGRQHEAHGNARFAGALPLCGQGRVLGLVHLRCPHPLESAQIPGDALRATALVAGGALAGLDGPREDESGEFGRDDRRRLQVAEAEVRRLRRLVHLKDEILATSVHDLRSPIGVLLCHIEILERGLRGEVTPRQQESLAKMRRQSDRLLELIDELLAAKEFGLDALDVAPAPGNLCSWLEEACEEERPAFAARDTELVVDLPPGAPAVRFDARQLRRVMQNLLTNARKFTPEGGRVEVSAVVLPDRVTISVRDTGPGVPPSDLERIFEPYHRVRLASRVPGVGLGLAISREIVDRHGGAIWAENRTPHGAVFRLSLPLDAPREVTPVPEPARPRALIVDDDAEFLAAAAETLEDGGFDVERASDGASALSAAREIAPDLILLDVCLPTVGGLEVAERLRRHGRFADTPILFMSGSDSPDERLRGLRLGSDYVKKPCSADELLARVRRALAATEERRESRAQASVDELTGLGNHRFFREKVLPTIAECAASARKVTLVVIDLDHLKRINETFGHDAGSRVLRDLGAAIRGESRRGDLLARYGGDEFVALLQEASSADAERLMARVRARLLSLQPADATFTPGFSAGVAEGASGDQDDPEALFRRADEELLRTKRARRPTTPPPPYARS